MSFETETDKELLEALRVCLRADRDQTTKVADAIRHVVAAAVAKHPWHKELCEAREMLETTKTRSRATESARSELELATDELVAASARVQEILGRL